jgi:mono/diheme cytochrome c family protein
MWIVNHNHTGFLLEVQVMFEKCETALRRGRKVRWAGAILGLFLVCEPLALSAQSKSNLSPQEQNGEGLYLRNCAYCHSPHKAESPAHITGPGDDPKNAMPGVTIGPPLKGILKGENALPEAAIRTFIMQGFPNQMPGFQYTLGPKQIDDLIAYIKSL